MKTQLVFLLFAFLLPALTHAQVAINDDSSTPETSAMLDVKSTSKGLLPPRMLQSQRTGISNPASGLVVYQTDIPSGLYVNTGSPSSPNWQFLGDPDIQTVLGVGNDAGGQTITNLPDPTAASEASTKGYVDGLVNDCEARIAIDTIPYVISASGSYYLTRDLTIVNSSHNGIRIDVSHVVLDLNGYTLHGTGSGTGDGIFVFAICSDIRVQNGVLYNWAHWGIDANNAIDSEFKDLNISSSGMDGIRCKYNCVLDNIYSYDNLDDGISVDSNCVITNCRANDNGENGISLWHHGMVNNCIANRNNYDGINGYWSSTYINCITHYNGQDGLQAGHVALVSYCNAFKNGHGGIKTGAHSLVTNCNAEENGYSYSGTQTGYFQVYECSGFNVSDNSYIKDCISRRNRGAGIVLYLYDSRCESNAVIDNDSFGIISKYNGCFIIKNSAAGNGTNVITGAAPGSNYSFAIAASYGPIVTVTGAGDFSSVTNSNHPWANFIY